MASPKDLKPEQDPDVSPSPAKSPAFTVNNDIEYDSIGEFYKAFEEGRHRMILSFIPASDDVFLPFL